MKNYLWLILIFMVSLPMRAMADRYGICEGSNCGGGPVNGIFAAILILIFLSFLGLKKAGIYLSVWLGPVIIAIFLDVKSFAAIWGILGFYLSIFITVWIIDFFKIDDENEIKNIESKKHVVKNISHPEVKNQIFDLDKKCFLIIIRQWTGGPYWARAFPAEAVIRKLRSININESNIYKMADIINSMGDYKFNLIDDLIDTGTEVIAESIDKSRVKAIRLIRVSAKEKGWNIILSEFDTVTNV